MPPTFIAQQQHGDIFNGPDNYTPWQVESFEVRQGPKSWSEIVGNSLGKIRGHSENQLTSLFQFFGLAASLNTSEISADDE